MADYTQPDIVNKRVRFFDGQFLQDQDFVDEQHYHVDRERRLARMIGLHGVVEGFAVSSPGAFQVRVAPGTAVDALGRQLVLPADLTLTMPANQFADAERVDLVLVHQEVETDVATTGSESARRFDESPRVAAVAEDGTVAVAPDGALPTWTGPTVLLARFDVDAAGAVTVDAASVARAGVGVPGAVGVGTVAPGAALDVVGAGGTAVDLRVTGRLRSTSADGGLWCGPDRLVGAHATARIGFLAGGDWRLSVGADGNVGIGTTAPENAGNWSRTLDVLGGASTKLSVRTGSIDARVAAHEGGTAGAPPGMVVGTASAHPLSLTTGGAARMAVHTSGDVGIGTGTAAPRARLEVSGAGGTNVDLLVNGRIRSNSNDGGLWVAADRFVGGNGADKVGFWNGGNWQLLVSKAGNVGVGAAPNDAYRLQVQGTGYFSDKLWCDGGIGFKWLGAWRTVVVNTSDGGGGMIAASDARLKTAIAPIADATAVVGRLSGVRFRWSESGLAHFTRDVDETVSAGPGATDAEDLAVRDRERARIRDAHAGEQFGLLAQDVEQVLPGLVTEGEDGYKSLHYHQLVGLLVEAVKEQQSTIARLGARLDALVRGDVPRA